MKTYLMLFVLVVFSGCSCKSVPFVACEVEYITETQEVLVPQKCSSPDTFCSKEGSLKEGTMSELLRWVYDLRESNKYCKGE